MRGRDRTRAIASKVRHLLVDGEVVVAGVELGLAGLAAASLGAAATAGDSAPSFRHDAELARSKAQAEDAGAKGVRFYLVLTDSRLLLVRRSGRSPSHE